MAIVTTELKKGEIKYKISTLCVSRQHADIDVLAPFHCQFHTAWSSLGRRNIRRGSAQLTPACEGFVRDCLDG